MPNRRHHRRRCDEAFAAGAMAAFGLPHQRAGGGTDLHPAGASDAAVAGSWRTFAAGRRARSCWRLRPFTMAMEKHLDDPTDHDTFQTPASRQYFGDTLWTDLHFSQIEPSRRKPIGAWRLTCCGRLRTGRGILRGFFALGCLAERSMH